MSTLPPPNRIPWPPIITLAGIVLAVAAQYFLPLPWFTGFLGEFLFMLGILMIAGSLGLAIHALLTIRRHDTTVMPHRSADHLVTEGPFRFSRNPIYVGDVGVTLGLGFALGNLWMFAAAIATGILINRLAILREERHLENAFGHAYRNYRKKVRRWI
mgnify:CR=1 FL=1